MARKLFTSEQTASSCELVLVVTIPPPALPLACLPPAPGTIERKDPDVDGARCTDHGKPYGDGSRELADAHAE